MLFEEGKKAIEIVSEVGKYVLKSLAKEEARIIREISDPERSDPSLDTDSGMNRTARPGEKVIALSYDDRAGVGESIYRGEILTVKAFHLGAYMFEERPADYDPYLGEAATPWHNAKSYMVLNDTSRAVVKYLDSIEAGAVECMDGIAHKVEEYRPRKKIGLVCSKGSIGLVLSEYEAVVLECAPVFEAFIKEQYDVREFVRNLGGTAPDNDVVIDNDWIKGSLQKISDKVRQGIYSKYRSVNWMAGGSLIEDIIQRFNTGFGYSGEKRSICDAICDPYKEYIVQALA